MDGGVTIHSLVLQRATHMNLITSFSLKHSKAVLKWHFFQIQIFSLVQLNQIPFYNACISI